LLRFHDEVLASAGTVWSDWDRFNPAWMESAVAEDFLARLPKVLEQEYGDARLLLVKDPRICRLLPLWLRVLSDLDITPKIVLPVRHPLEVARSLEVRNEFGRQRSYLTWLRHMLDAEYHSRGHKRVVVGYADMLADWRQQVDRISRELAIKWPKWSGSVEADIDGYLTTELRHHAAGEEIPADSSDIAGWVAQAYRAFMQLTVPGAELEDIQRALDQVREDFDQSSAIYAAVVRDCENKAQARVRELNGRMAEEGERYAGLVKEIAGLAEAIERGKTDLAGQSSPSTGELATLAERLHAERVAHAQSATADAERLSDLSAQLAASRESLSRAASAHEAELARLAEAHAALISDLSAQLATSRESLSRAASAHEAMLADREEQVGRLQTQLAQCIEKHESRIAEIDERHAGEINRLQEDGMQAERSLQERFSEIAKLTTIVFDLERELEKERASHASDKRDSDAKLADVGRTIEKERAIHANDKREWHALSAGLERELELHRRLAADRLEQVRRMQEGKSWKAITLLRRLIRPGQRTPALDAPAVSDGEAIRESGLFDQAWYLRRYPDVRKRGFDPLDHYLRYGAKEGRDPGPAFRTRDYLRRYPDVAASGVNPLLHYVRFGVSEGRRARDRGEGGEG
ncbi:MAG TPA: hypothetical protein VFG44_04330, partial [Burkholderiales bacterium]|nr:hypothetical protein [Burkholderiales bacterium]